MYIYLDYLHNLRWSPISVGHGWSGGAPVLHPGPSHALQRCRGTPTGGLGTRVGSGPGPLQGPEVSWIFVGISWGFVNKCQESLDFPGLLKFLTFADDFSHFPIASSISNAQLQGWRARGRNRHLWRAWSLNTRTTCGNLLVNKVVSLIVTVGYGFGGCFWRRAEK